MRDIDQRQECTAAYLRSLEEKARQMPYAFSEINLKQQASC